MINLVMEMRTHLYHIGRFRKHRYLEKFSTSKQKETWKTVVQKNEVKQYKSMMILIFGHESKNIPGQ